jgi:hypothetical protein
MAQTNTATKTTTVAPAAKGNTKPLSDKAKQYEGKWDELLKTHGNISKAIRFLHSEGLARGEIAKISGKKYQHVRNVLITPVGTTKK